MLLFASCSVRTEGQFMQEMSSEVQFIKQKEEGNAEYPNLPVEIEGIVSPGVQGVSMGDRVHIQFFSLQAWRQLPDGKLVQSKLVVLRPVPEDYDYEAAFPAGSTHRFKLLLSACRTRSIYLTSTKSKTTPDFQAILENQSRPKRVRVERFGTFLLDRLINSFDGMSVWNGQQVTVAAPALNEEIPAECISTLKSLWAEERVWQDRIEQFLVDELMSLKNEKWLKEGEKKISKKEFLKALELETVEILENGRFKFWFSDGGLFWGHGVTVSGSLANGLDDANLHG